MLTICRLCFRLIEVVTDHWSDKSDKDFCSFLIAKDYIIFLKLKCCLYERIISRRINYDKLKKLICFMITNH